MSRHFETMFETGVDEMSWDDTVRPYLCIPSDDYLLLHKIFN